MSNNVIAFAARNATRTRRARPTAAAGTRTDNVVSLSAWADRARPRRTPTGVYFTTGVLVTKGLLA